MWHLLVNRKMTYFADRSDLYQSHRVTLDALLMS